MGSEPCTQETFQARLEAELARRRSRNDINQMMQLDLTGCDAQTRTVTFLHPAEDWEVNIYGTLHGGLISLLLDASMAVTCRAWTVDKATPTLDIHVNFISPAKQGLPVHTQACVVHAGRNIVQMRAELWTGDFARLCATADANFYRADAKTPG